MRFLKNIGIISENFSEGKEPKMAIFNESLYRTPVYDVTVYNQTEILAHKFSVEAPWIVWMITHVNIKFSILSPTKSCVV